MWSAITLQVLFGFLLSTTNAQEADVVVPAVSQNVTFNSTYGPLNPAQATARIAQGGFSQNLSAAVLTALNFERSNWAGSSTQLDPFYNDLPANSSTAPAGSVIKVEQYTNSTFYTLAPNVALSRFVFNTKNFNGTTIPASAFVLWPWMPRRSDNVSGLPVVVWGHGTSGFSGECAPSHIRNLWYQFSAPFTLALQGYVVVAPDYAGLGIDQDCEGNFIPHQYLAYPAHANDLIYSFKAARQAWPELSKEFVVMGHSQGGGAAWAAAQLLAESPVDGYLGTVAGSPGTAIQTSVQYNAGKPASIGSYLVRAGLNLASIFPPFSLNEWLVEKGVRAANLLQDLQGCQSVTLELISSQPDLLREDWNSTWYFSQFNSLTRNGGKPFAGPMLVLQGTNDSAVFEPGTTAAVNATRDAYPEGSQEYALFDGADHVPTLFAGQQVWLNWIADRFSGKPAAKGYQSTLYHPQLPVASYQKELAYFLEYPEYAYETA